MAIFLGIDLSGTMGTMRTDLQTEISRVASGKSFTSATTSSFDANTKFYLCAGKNGASPRACTVAEFVLEYRYYGENSWEMAHLGGTNRIS